MGERLAEAGDPFRDPSGLDQGVAEVVVRFGVGGVEAERLAIGADGFAVAVQPDEDIGKIKVRVGEEWVELNRAGQKGDRFVELAGIGVQAAQILVRGREVRTEL